MPKINRRPQITERSEAREDVSSLMRLNWLEDASNNAVGYATKYPRDPFKTEATIELRDVARLLLVLMHDPEVNGNKDLGRRYVEIRSEQLRLNAVNRRPSTSPHDWTPDNEESEPPF
ncbi:hypothetical protein SEA_TATTMODD_36 [Arthrobacter phage TattModd]|uniref:Uncharacterized protein n=10 Tax=Korravirus TaxID=1982076 RepID=A0A3S9U9X9_9CAUD|nr:hypothetical protein FDH57_gp37 [Arthrobacter phage Glenn]AOT24127.1 hypothetical protein SEA_VALLEJO_37 [Arthrobacter phage Vallejo]AZF97413.1 hypothetical protein SEA_CARPAL_36 [Arthrobacter phage Carpal]AZF98501.1 hypothetical protein SEA_BEETHOVEN_37 [Arthrobacter phage Beethoven]AZS07080.1 hypothetical protein SEA_CHOLULA_36 [Arthrobacter phage Cholula]AZS09729.1 hypothetical protein SEA_RIVERDALE_37 [Arthrobacter phage Riverdale]AZS09790.1 hypothetical protein SEA_ROZBY_37 [Arthrobac